MGNNNTHPVDLPSDKSKPLTRQNTTLDTPSRHKKTPPHIPPRPTIPLNRQNSVQTRYMSMLLALDTIPRVHNILISFFTWLLLAGFIIFPGTFTSLSTTLSSDTSSSFTSSILHSVKNIQLLITGGVCSGVGALGMIYLWYRWRTNYVWLLNRIFLPGFLNSLVGLIGTLINVYSQQDGDWSVTARVTAIVTGSIMVVCGVLFGLYNFWILRRVKRTHGREWIGNGQSEEEEDGEGLKEKIVRKAQEPALEPGSVV